MMKKYLTGMASDDDEEEEDRKVDRAPSNMDLEKG